MNNSVAIDEKAQGLGIYLYRRPIYHSGGRKIPDNFPFLTFGYFDGVEFKRKSNIQGLYDANKDLKNSKYSLFEEQHIYILLNEINDQLSKKIDSLIDSGLRKRNNLLIITELKLDERILVSNKLQDCRNEIIEKIRLIIQSAKKTNPQKFPGDFEHEIFDSLSYSDFVLISRADSFEEVDYVINNLRLCKVGNVPIFRSTYSILGFPNKRIFQNEDKCKNYFTANEKVNVLLQAAVEPSKKVKEIKEEMEEFVSTLKHVSKKQIDIPTWTVFGKYDVIFNLKDFYQYQIIQIRGLLLEEFNETIYFTNTRFLFDVPYLEIPQGEKHIVIDKEDIGNLIQRINSLTSWVANLQKKINKNNQNGKYVQNDFRNLVRKFEQVLINESINPYVLQEIGQIIEVIYQNINSPQSATAVRVASEFIDQQNQASQTTFEIPTHDFQIIGSIESIASFYASIIEGFEEKIFRSLDKDSEWVLFLTMNHSATIDSHHYFYSSRLIQKEKRKMLVSITFGRQSFFDLKNSIPYLFHEIGHYIPSTKVNNKRLINIYIQGITNDICKLIILFLYNKLNYFIFSNENNFQVSERIIKKLSGYFLTELNKELEQILVGHTELQQMPLNDFSMQLIFEIISFKLFGQYNHSVFDLYTFDPDIRYLRRIIEEEIPELIGDFDEVLENVVKKIDLIPDDKKEKFKLFAEKYPTLKEKFIRITNDCIESHAALNYYQEQIKYIYQIIQDHEENFIEILRICNIGEKRDFPKDFIQITTNFIKILKNNSQKLFVFWQTPIDILFDEIKKSIETISLESLHGNGFSKGGNEEVETSLINFAKYCILEDSPKNKKSFFNFLMRNLCSNEAQSALLSDVKIWFTIIKEAKADYYMCKLLDIDADHYQKIIEDNLIKQGKDHDEVFLSRSKIINEIITTKKHDASSFITDPSTIKKNVKDLCNVLNFQELSKYLEEVQSNECTEIEKIFGYHINELRDLYHKILLDDENLFTNEVNLIEYFNDIYNLNGWKS